MDKEGGESIGEEETGAGKGQSETEKSTRISSLFTSFSCCKPLIIVKQSQAR